MVENRLNDRNYRAGTDVNFSIRSIDWKRLNASKHCSLYVCAMGIYTWRKFFVVVLYTW